MASPMPRYLLGLLGRARGEPGGPPSAGPQPTARQLCSAIRWGSTPGDRRRFATRATAVGEAVRELYPALPGAHRCAVWRCRGAPRLAGTPARRRAGRRGRGAGGAVGEPHRAPAVRGPGGRAVVRRDAGSVWARPSARITGHPGEVRRPSRQTTGPSPAPRTRSTACPAEARRALSRRGGPNRALGGQSAKACVPRPTIKGPMSIDFAAVLTRMVESRRPTST